MALFDFSDLSSLSDVELTVYRFVVNNPDKVAYMRVRDIAIIRLTLPILLSCVLSIN